ncbi:MAG: DUF5989 family protein [Candidatus Woesearchaeota archaeon]
MSNFFNDFVSYATRSKRFWLLPLIILLILIAIFIILNSTLPVPVFFYPVI